MKKNFVKTVYMEFNLLHTSWFHLIFSNWEIAFLNAQKASLVTKLKVVALPDVWNDLTIFLLHMQKVDMHCKNCMYDNERLHWFDEIFVVFKHILELFLKLFHYFFKSWKTFVIVKKFVFQNCKYVFMQEVCKYHLGL